MVGIKQGEPAPEDALQINANSGTVTLSGADGEAPKEEAGIPAGLTRFQPVVPALPMTQITTAGKGEEMLNILVNDSSFSTNQDKKKRKKGKKGGKSKQPKVAKPQPRGSIRHFVYHLARRPLELKEKENKKENKKENHKVEEEDHPRDSWHPCRESTLTPLDRFFIVQNDWIHC